MKYIIQFTLILFFTISLHAQDKTVVEELGMDQLTEKQKLEILAYAITLKKDYKKSLKKALKKLSPEEKEKLMAYIDKTKGVRKNKSTKPTIKPKGPTTTIEFEKTEHDFGEANEGDKITYIYKFKNTGKKPLTITHAKGSCGCTVPKWPKEPIKPGKKGEIEVVFNTKGKRGNQVKTITLTANTSPEKTMLRIKGKVKSANQ